MKVLYENTSGKIYYAVSDVEYPYFTHSTNVPLEVGEVEETENNKIERIEIIKSLGRYDAQGEQRFYVSSGEIVERENWEEFKE